MFYFYQGVFNLNYLFYDVLIFILKIIDLFSTENVPPTRLKTGGRFFTTVYGGVRDSP